MAYDPTGYYPAGYDHRGMPIPMHGGGYDVPLDMYYPQPAYPVSSRSRNPTDVDKHFFFFVEKSNDVYLCYFLISMNKKSMHSFDIQQHQVLIQIMIRI